MFHSSVSHGKGLAQYLPVSTTEATNDRLSNRDDRNIKKERSNNDSRDAHLIHALRGGQEEAFCELIDRYHSSLMRLARTYVSSQAVAEEVVQETWMGVLEGIKRFEGRSSIKTWLFRILSNRAKTRGQRERRYCSFDDLSPNHGDHESTRSWEESGRLFSTSADGAKWSVEHWDDKTPDRHLLSKEGLEQIEHAIQQLPNLQRQTIILRDVEELEATEACSLLGVSMTNQRVLLHRARTKVRQVLAEYL